MNVYRVAAAVTIVALGACSGGKGGSLVPSAPAATATPPGAGSGTSGSSRATLTVVVPHAAAASTKRAPKYVSPSSAALSVAVNGGTATSYGLTATSPGCAVVSGNTTCTFSIVAPAGHDAFALSITDGAGAALSRNVVSATVASGVATPLAVTLAGVPASVAVVPGTGAVIDSPSAPYHAPGLNPQPVEIEPLDADGNIIIGPGAPTINSVSIASGGTYATVASANTSDPAAFVLTPVDGTAGGKTVTVSATAQGVALADGTASQPITSTTAYLFTPAIAIASGPNVFEYSLESSALITAFPVCPGDCPLTFATTMAADSKGNLAIAFTQVGGITVLSQISLIPHGATRETAILGTTAGVQSVGGIAFDSGDNMWVASGAHGGFHQTYVPQDIVKFAPGGTSPILTITDAPTSPEGIAVDGAGNVFVSDSNNTNTILVYASGAVDPTGTLSDPNLALPGPLALDASGGLYVADQQNNDLAYFARGATTAATTTLFDGTFSNGLSGLLYDPQGDLWVGISGANETERLAGTSLPNTVNAISYLPQPGAPAWIP